MGQALEERLGASKKLTGLADAIEVEPALDEVRGFAHEFDARLDIVDHADIAVFVGAIDVGKLDRRTTVAAIEENEQTAVRWKRRDERSMKYTTGYLTIRFKIDWDLRPVR